METAARPRNEVSPPAQQPVISSAGPGVPDAAVSVRRYPYPYKAMLAICSDLDSTPDWRTYWEIVKFLNTTEAASMGPGVGLEVGNSIYFDQRPEEFAYWNTDDAGRALVRALIRSGHIDCLHSYGNLAITRQHAGRALDELARHNLRLEVWVDHGWSPTNFGPDIMLGHGDEPGHPAYHADLTIAHGIRYVWRGRVSSVIGQDAKSSLGGLFWARHPLWSGRTLARETAKRVLAGCGSKKYAMHGPNRLLRLTRLRDGRRMWEFLRSNPHWGGVSSCDTGEGLGEVLTEGVLRRLAARRGVCVLYTHLGKFRDNAGPFPASTQAALRRLATLHQSGEILVTTTHRLLRFLAVRGSLGFQAERIGDSTVITIEAVADPMEGTRRAQLEEVQGITFEVPHRGPVELRLRGAGRIASTIVCKGDTTFVSVPWPALVLPSP